MSMPSPTYLTPAIPVTLLSEDRAEVTAALLEHGLDDEYVRELLDFAELHGDAQSAAVRVFVNGAHWTADLFGPRQEAA